MNGNLKMKSVSSNSPMDLSALNSELSIRFNVSISGIPVNPALRELFREGNHQCRFRFFISLASFLLIVMMRRSDLEIPPVL